MSAEQLIKSYKAKSLSLSNAEVNEILGNRDTIVKRLPLKTPSGNRIGLQLPKLNFALGGKLVIYKDEQGKGKVYFRSPVDYIEPRYQLDSIVYVKESWSRISNFTIVDPEVGIPDGYLYRADWHKGEEAPVWYSPVTMPREATRIFLQVQSIALHKPKDKSGWSWEYTFQYIEQRELYNKLTERSEICKQ